MAALSWMAFQTVKQGAKEGRLEDMPPTPSGRALLGPRVGEVHTQVTAVHMTSIKSRGFAEEESPRDFKPILLAVRFGPDQSNAIFG